MSPRRRRRGLILLLLDILGLLIFGLVGVVLGHRRLLVVLVLFVVRGVGHLRWERRGRGDRSARDRRLAHGATALGRGRCDGFTLKIRVSFARNGARRWGLGARRGRVRERDRTRARPRTEGMVAHLKFPGTGLERRRCDATLEVLAPPPPADRRVPRKSRANGQRREANEAELSIIWRRTHILFHVCF